MKLLIMHIILPVLSSLLLNVLNVNQQTIQMKVPFYGMYLWSWLKVKD